MRSMHNVHAEFGRFYQSSNLHLKAGLAVAFIVCGSIAGASGLVLQMTGHELNVDGRSVIATIPLSPSTTTIVAPEPAMSASESQQASTSPSNSPQTARLNAIATTVIAPTREAILTPRLKRVWRRDQQTKWLSASRVDDSPDAPFNNIFSLWTET